MGIMIWCIYVHWPRARSYQHSYTHDMFLSYMPDDDVCGEGNDDDDGDDGDD